MNTKLQELYSLKQQKEVLDAQLKGIKEQIADIELEIGNSTVFPQDKKMLSYNQDNFAVKIEKKETLKWDQDKLNQARITLGDDTFLNLFGFEWKHKQKAVLDNFIKTDARAKVVQDALTITHKFNVSIEQGA